MEMLPYLNAYRLLLQFGNKVWQGEANVGKQFVRNALGYQTIHFSSTRKQHNKYKPLNELQVHFFRTTSTLIDNCIDNLA